jgi:hypothetical protein
MTTKQADKAIKGGLPVQFTELNRTTVHSLLFVKRDRFTISGVNGELFERGDLTLI